MELLKTFFRMLASAVRSDTPRRLNNLDERLLNLEERQTRIESRQSSSEVALMGIRRATGQKNDT